MTRARSRKFYRRLSLVFAAGCLGGLANSLAVWAAGASGFTGALGVKLAPAFTPAWLYPRLVWGGLWGLLFLLPIRRLSYVFRGLVFSLAPALAQLLLFFPLKNPENLWGLKLGVLTPLLVLGFNAVWGLAAGLWLSLAGEDI